ncbi:angiopoietin-related protein 1-like [Zophobas morio]|uniref:angiopoietin-related protein 1-like n=1 Tax=Zophobas morio TaxID=2755281 RepID=UPI0030836B9E
MIPKKVFLLLLVIPNATLLQRSCDSSTPNAELEILTELRNTVNKLNERIHYLENTLEKKISEVESKIENNSKTDAGNIKPLQTEHQKMGEGVCFFENPLKESNSNFTTKIHGCKNLPRNCKEVQDRGYNVSAIYRIQPRVSNNSFLVWCNMSTRGGGWVSVLNRVDGSQSFSFNWSDYKTGFGSLSGEHWLGLDYLHELTNSQRNELLIELVHWDLKNVFAFYDDFNIGNETVKYILNSLGNYVGNAGDSFKHHVGIKFSTPDQDENVHDESCAAHFQTGWWFTNCYKALLTGDYVIKPKPGDNYQVYKSGIMWYDAHRYNYNLKKANMLIRPFD